MGKDSPLCCSEYSGVNIGEAVPQAPEMLTLSFHIYHEAKLLMSSNKQVSQCRVEPLQVLQVTQSALLTLTLASGKSKPQGLESKNPVSSATLSPPGSKVPDKALNQTVREISLQHLSPRGSSRNI